MKMETENLNQSSFVFKVLNGSLNGVEFTLGKQSHFICLNEEVAKQANLSDAARVLYIPVPNSGSNFSLELEQDRDDNLFEIHVSFPDRIEKRLLRFNKIEQVEGLTFAVRSEEDIWSDEVTGGIFAPDQTNKPDEEVIESARTAETNPFKKLQSKTKIIVTVLMLFGLTILGWKFYPDLPLRGQNNGANPAFLKSMVGGLSENQVHIGRDKINYVFTINNQQYDIATQIISRNHLDQEWKVLTSKMEENRISNLLERNNVAFFTIHFTDPSNPILLLSSNRNEISEKNLGSIKKLLLDAMPYAENVSIVLEEDSEVLRKAQQGLQALGINFVAVQSDSGVALSGRLPMVDIHLNEFSRFVSQFYQTWGRHYIHFSAEINEDSLKDKSYKYGEGGQVMMSKSHWHFMNKID